MARNKPPLAFMAAIAAAFGSSAPQQLHNVLTILTNDPRRHVPKAPKGGYDERGRSSNGRENRKQRNARRSRMYLVARGS